MPKDNVVPIGFSTEQIAAEYGMTEEEFMQLLVQKGIFTQSPDGDYIMNEPYASMNLVFPQA